MAERTVLIDFDPWSEVSHHAHLAHQHARTMEDKFESHSREMTHAISAQTRDLVKGFAPLQATQVQTQKTLDQLLVGSDKVERAIERSGEVIASAISWGIGRLSGEIGSLKSELGGKLDTLIKEQRKTSRNWAYEQFEIAISNFKKGLYEEARDRVELAIGGSPPAHLGYKEEFWFHYLLGNVHLGSWAGEKPNVDPKVVDARLAEKAFLAAARYADREADRSEAFLCAGRSAFVQRELTRAIAHTSEAIAGSKRPGDVHYQLAKCHAALPDLSGGNEAGRQLRTALLLNLDLLFDAWAEEAYFNRVGALEAALLPAAADLRAAVRTEIDNYRLAGCFASFANGRSEAVHHLRASVDKRLDVIGDAVEDLPRLNREGVLDEVIQSKAAELRENAQRELDYFARAFRFIGTVSHGEYSPRRLFDAELGLLEETSLVARENVSKGSISDLNAAIVALASRRAALDGIRSEYLSRLKATLHEKWRETREHKSFMAAKADFDRIPKSFHWPDSPLDGLNLQFDSDTAFGCLLAFLFAPLVIAIAFVVLAIYLIKFTIATFEHASWQASLRKAERKLTARQAAADKLWRKSQAIIDDAEDTTWAW